MCGRFDCTLSIYIHIYVRVIHYTVFLFLGFMFRFTTAKSQDEVREIMNGNVIFFFHSFFEIAHKSQNSSVSYITKKWINTIFRSQKAEKTIFDVLEVNLDENLIEKKILPVEIVVLTLERFLGSELAKTYIISYMRKHFNGVVSCSFF